AACSMTKKTHARSVSTVLFTEFNNASPNDINQVNESGPNFYYVNNGDGTFREASYESGLAVDGFGNSQGTMGVTVGYYNTDGLMDILITNWIHQDQTLYEHQGSHAFMDATRLRGLSGIGYE